jgi:hypothetical protein
MANRSWTFESRRNPGVTYEVEPDEDGRLHCTCPAFHFASECSHVEAVTMRLALDQEAGQAHQGDEKGSLPGASSMPLSGGRS